MAAGLENYSCKACKSRAGFIFQPKKPFKANLEALSKKIGKKGAEINALTPRLLVAKYNGLLVTFYANGKAMIKSQSKQSAEKALLDLIGQQT